jgi:hypothetical protein
MTAYYSQGEREGLEQTGDLSAFFCERQVADGLGAAN